MLFSLLLSLNFATTTLVATTTEKDTIKNADLNSIVISATKFRVMRSSVPNTLSVIEKESIESSVQGALLPVLGREVPGLFVTQKGVTGFGVSEGSAGVINIRGVGQGNKVLMLLDGQPQWAGLFGHALPDLYVASDVEKVEVIRGPGSLMYGSNAMGGVINVITHEHLFDGRTTRARIMYGSYNTQKYLISNGYSKGKLSSFVSVNHDRTNGHRERSDFRITNGFAKVGYKFNDRYKAVADLSLAKYYSQNPGAEDAPLLENTMDIFRGSASLSLENTYEKSSGAIKLYYNFGDHKINDGHSPDKLPQTTFFNSSDHNLGGMIYQSLSLFKNNNITIGADYKNWGGRAWNSQISQVSSLPDVEIVNKRVTELAAYAIAQQEFVRVLTINGGVRYEINSIFGGEWVPQVGVTLRAFRSNIIKLIVSKGFRSPNIREMYMFPPQNPGLRPESMINYELSAGQTFLGGNLITELGAFIIDGKDMIGITRIEGRPKNDNTGSFLNKGFEFETKWRVKKDLRLDLSYSYLNTDKPLLAAPKHNINFNVRYTPGTFSFGVNTQYIGGLYVNTNPTNLRKESYTLINFSAAWKTGWNKLNTTLFLKGDNLTNHKYYINYGFPMPGIVISAGADITF